MRISVLMPTYNDEKHIRGAIDSVLRQTHRDLQLIIIDDGSTDGTARVLGEIQDPRVVVLRQSNQDQLNAMLAGASHVSGDVVMFLHSDDELAGDDSLERLVAVLGRDSGVQGLFADILTMDAAGQERGRIQTAEAIDESTIKFLLRFRGSNPVGDPFVVRKRTFDELIVPNYLNSNRVYYFVPGVGPVKDFKKTEPWYKYRVFSENYATSDIGKFVLSNGSIRTVRGILDAGYRLEPIVLAEGLGRRLLGRIPSLERAVRLKKDPRVRYSFALRYFNGWLDEARRASAPAIVQHQLRAISRSLRSNLRAHKKATLLVEEPRRSYFGKDARQFYKDYESGVLPGLYLGLLLGKYDRIVAKSEAALKAARTAVDFLGLYISPELE